MAKINPTPTSTPIPISFTILDDLEPIMRLDGSGSIRDKQDIVKFIQQVTDSFGSREDGKRYDPTYFFRYEEEYEKSYDSNGVLIDSKTQVLTLGPRDIDQMAEELLKNKYYVLNRVNKYYVIAFALNFHRFDVFSKDCDKQLIKWRQEDQDDPVVRQIEDPDYNENPVITMMRTIPRS
jgi:hypothetical protein